MKNTDDTIDTPGRVRMIWKAGRIVLAVVWAAPDTMPSASPVWTIIVPKNETSWTMSSARSGVTPLWARSRAYSAANRSSSGDRAGSTTRAPSRRTPSCAARRWTAASSPRRTRSATSRDNSVAAARMMRSSSPSGSTMRRRSARARSMSIDSNISGVTTSLRGTSTTRSSSSASMWRSKVPSAVSTLRRLVGVSRPRVAATRRAVV